MLTWRLTVEEGRKTGHTFSQPDLIIAAIAAHHGLTVVSRDVTDLQRAKVSITNPWRKTARSRETQRGAYQPVARRSSSGASEPSAGWAALPTWTFTCSTWSSIR